MKDANTDGTLQHTIDRDEILSMIHDYYTDLYTQADTDITLQSQLLDKIQTHISNTSHVSLENEIQLEQMESVVTKMHNAEALNVMVFL